MKEVNYYVFDEHSQFSPVYAERVLVCEDKIIFYDGDRPVTCLGAHIIKSIPRTWGFFPASLRDGRTANTKTELLLSEMNGFNYLRLVFPKELYSVDDGYSLLSLDERKGFIPSWVAWDRHENLIGEIFDENKVKDILNTNRVSVDTNDIIKRP